MVELKGSEKQIKWANDIRECLLSACVRAIDCLEQNNKEIFEKKGKRLKRLDKRIEVLKVVKTEFEENSDSSFFISNYSKLLNLDDEKCVNYMLEESLNRI